jgi:hypothetical protein
MEKINTDISKLTINDNLSPPETFISYNFRQLAKHIEAIRKNYFSETNLPKLFSIDIFYFKRITKEKTIIQVMINHKVFLLNYEYLGLSTQIMKNQKKDLPGNLIDELFENFQPLGKLNFFSDNLNFAGNYTVKHIVNDCKKLNEINLNNFLFKFVSREDDKNLTQMNNSLFPLALDENLNFLKKFSEKTNIQDLSFNFLFDEKNSKENFFKNLKFLIDNIINKKSKNINFKIYHEDYIDFNLDLNTIFEKNKFSTLSYDLSELKFTFINTNTKSPKIISFDDLKILALNILYKFTPEFFELNIFEILNSKNSKISEEINILKISKIMYTKKFFCIVNSLKNNFTGAKNLNYKLNHKILNHVINFLNLKFDDIFEIKTNHLQLILPKENQNKKFNQLKFLFNLEQDYESLLERKIKYEEIFSMITTKPKEENEISNVNIVKLKKFDLNSISKILSKIEGNNFLFLNDGRKVSVGGKFNKIINGIQYSQGLNTIIEINKNFSKIKIMTFNDNYFLSSFNSAAGVLYKEKNSNFEEFIIQVGGLSIQELLPNFAYTPIFKINTKNLEISRIIPSDENKILPNVIFSHKIKIIENKFLEISEGYVIKNYSGGLNILQKEISEKGKELSYIKITYFIKTLIIYF